MAVMNLNQLFLLFTGQLKEDDLVLVVESEDAVVLDDLKPESRGRA